jgi:ABC-type proline/glycine betaine transport system permease subunit
MVTVTGLLGLTTLGLTVTDMLQYLDIGDESKSSLNVATIAYILGRAFIAILLKAD